MFKPIFILVIYLLPVFGVFGFDQQLEIKRAKLSAMYATVAEIETAQEMFFAENGSYAVSASGANPYRLCFSDDSRCRADFGKILGVNIMSDSLFAYEVSGKPVKLSVKVIAAGEEGVLCYKFLEGPKKGRWFLNVNHSWAPSFSASGVEMYEP